MAGDYRMSTSPPSRKPHPKPWNHKVDYVVKVCIASLRGLPDRQSREIALGQIIAGLQHSDHLKGFMSVLAEVTASVNHYHAPIE